MWEVSPLASKPSATIRRISTITSSGTGGTGRGGINGWVLWTEPEPEPESDVSEAEMRLGMSSS